MAMAGTVAYKKQFALKTITLSWNSYFFADNSNYKWFN